MKGKRQTHSKHDYPKNDTVTKKRGGNSLPPKVGEIGNDSLPFQIFIIIIILFRCVVFFFFILENMKRQSKRERENEKTPKI